MIDAPVHYLKISIKDPMRSHDGFGAHINYQIDTNSNIPGYIYGDTNVIRRYSDFTWLSTELSRVCAGCIVPALPEKQTVGRFYPEFVESRRRALERFLVNVAAHKELNTSPVFIAFLQADDAALHAAKDYSVIATKKISTKAIAWFEEKVNVMTIGKIELERTPEDREIDSIADYVLRLEMQISRVSGNAEQLARNCRDTAKLMGDVGVSMEVLGNMEVGVIGTTFLETGKGIGGLHAVHTHFAEAQSIYFEQPLKDYIRLLASVKLALQQRFTKREEYLSALTDVEAKKIAYNKFASQTNKSEKASIKQVQLQRSLALAKESKIIFEIVTVRLLSEFRFFQEQKVHDLGEILQNFIDKQVDFHRDSLEKWIVLQKDVKKDLLSTSNNPPDRSHASEDILAMAKSKNKDEKDEFESKEFTDDDDDDIDIDQFYENNKEKTKITAQGGTTETVNDTDPVKDAVKDTVKDTKTAKGTDTVKETVTTDDGFTAIEREDITVSV